MTEELKPCECGNESPLLHSGGEHVFVECICCGVETLGYKDDDKAIEVWNDRDD